MRLGIDKAKRNTRWSQEKLNRFLKEWPGEGGCENFNSWLF